MRLDLEDGKYTILSEGGKMQALRYGEQWRDLTGDKLIGALMSRIEELEAAKTKPSREDLARLLAALFHGQYSTGEDEKTLHKQIRKALKNYDIGAGEFVKPSQPEHAAQAQTAEAFAAIKTAMTNDPGYAWSWQCNIAVPFMDAWPEPKPDNLHQIANEGAARFMSIAFDVDVRKFPEWQSLARQWAELAAPSQPEAGRVGLTAEQIERHSIAASDCPPDSQVILVSSIRRLLAAKAEGEQ